MQDRYAGDAGDFFKFALLRCLCAMEPLRKLGVIWYLFPNEFHNEDGRHIQYLAKNEFIQLEPDLISRLKNVVSSGDRSIGALERAGVLPADAVTHREPIVSPTTSFQASRAGRISHREGWFGRALDVTCSADIVFFDPDNGIESRSVRPGSSRVGKYALATELSTVWKRGQSLIIYQHAHRRTSVYRQAEDAAAWLRGELPGNPSVSTVLFRRGSCRFFFIVAQERHIEAVQRRVQTFIGRDWYLHAERL